MNQMTYELASVKPPKAWQAQAIPLLTWIAIDWLLIFFGWWILSAYNNAFAIGAGTLLIAGRLHALGVILHDACHRPSQRKTPAWWLVEALAGWPIASTIPAMRYHHLRHHRHSCTAQDPYRKTIHGNPQLAFILLRARGVLLPPWWTLRAIIAPIALLFPSVRNFYGRAFLQDRSGSELRNNKELLRCARADLAQLSAHIVVAIVILRFDLPFVSHYLIPILIAGVLNAHRVAIEHTTDELSEVSRSAVIATTRTHDVGWIGNWLLYPHNIGLHLAHHLQPAVAFVHLKKVQSSLSASTAPGN